MQPYFELPLLASSALLPSLKIGEIRLIFQYFGYMPLFSAVLNTNFSDLPSDYEHCFKMMFPSLSGPVAFFNIRLSKSSCSI